MVPKDCTHRRVRWYPKIAPLAEPRPPGPQAPGPSRGTEDWPKLFHAPIFQNLEFFGLVGSNLPKVRTQLAQRLHPWTLERVRPAVRSLPSFVSALFSGPKCTLQRGTAAGYRALPAEISRGCLTLVPKDCTRKGAEFCPRSQGIFLVKIAPIP